MVETSDVMILDLLRKLGPQSVAQLAQQMQVTATAVRQRLTRLLAQEFIERTAAKHGRGRPVHRYDLTEKGRRKSGANFADLAIALWQEIREIKDVQVRRGLLARISKRLASMYAERIDGPDIAARMQAVADVFGDRKIPFDVEQSGDQPYLRTLACPYPDLAEKDRTICSMERMLFSELLGQNVTLEDCRLDGDSCCTFHLATIEPLAAGVNEEEGQSPPVGETPQPGYS
jgi:predicted ArsR family transcriptional regulator